MYGESHIDQAFIKKLTEIIHLNLENENFGIDELAHASGMTRSAIYKRLLAITEKSTTQFIREVRLQRAMELLKQESTTASEIAYKVGFGSPAYFNTCFHEYFGFPPGEVLKNNRKDPEEPDPVPESEPANMGENGQAEKIKKSRRNISVKQVVIWGMLGLMITISLLFLNKRANNRNSEFGLFTWLKGVEKSIAVLPFKNLSNDPNNQYFADGIMEDILNHLYKVREFRVISRTSVEQFRESNKSAPEIAKSVGVNFILEGSVLQYEGQVRVRVQLIDARNDRYILTEQFDRNFQDIFIIQSTIAKLIAEKLQTVLTTKEVETIEKVQTHNEEAYKLYLMGRFFYKKRVEDGELSKEALLRSREYYEKSISMDPDYPSAYAGLAKVCYILAWWGHIPTKNGFEMAKKNALRALELDKNLPEAHTVLGQIYTFSEWRWEEARKEFIKAIELNPNYPFAHANYSELLNILGEDDAARSEINHAFELDPTLYYFYRLSSIYYFNTGKLDDSLIELNKMLIFTPATYIYSLWQKFYIYDRKNDDLHAIETLKKLVTDDYPDTNYPALIDTIYPKSGMTGIYSFMAAVLSGETNASALSVAQLYARLGKKDKAIAYLHKALNKREIRLPYINNDPRLVNIRQEPEFREFIDKLGLSNYFNPSKDFSPVAD